MDEHPRTHDFDFWFGSWSVADPTGRTVGSNTIRPLFGGLAVLEEWEGVGGILGRSLSAWDTARGAWHQTWMDSTGSTLLLDGGMREGAMVLEGTAPAVDGEGIPVEGKWDRHRISWTASTSGDAVRQLWETSTDGGATWSIGFDGRYHRL